VPTKELRDKQRTPEYTAWLKKTVPRTYYLIENWWDTRQGKFQGRVIDIYERHSSQKPVSLTTLPSTA